MTITTEHKKYLSITKLYKPYYESQKNYFHNYDHALFTTNAGLEILEKSDAPEYVQEAFAHGMSAHSAHHLCGTQKNDDENIERALIILNNISLAKPGKNVRSEQIVNVEDNFTLVKELAALIIKDTRTPYDQTPKQIASIFSGNINDAILAIKVARDIDTLGIIGIKGVKERERALIGLMREHLRTKSPKDLMDEWEGHTEQFFQTMHLYTDICRQWAEENLSKAKTWQLGFYKQAIEAA